MSKKYMVRCDIEGVTGVVSFEQAEPGKPEYAFGQRMFMSDLMALLQGLSAGGADEIVVYDEHYYGRNSDLDDLPANTSVICGKPPYRADWAGGLDESFAGVILLGFHSKAGTPGGLLHHTYELDTRDLRLNGASIGETGVEAAVAGDYGVPVVMITADSAGVAEAEALLPGIVGVTVKESLGETGGQCYSVAVTAERISSAAQRVVEEPPSVQPYSVGDTATLEVELDDGPYLEAVRSHLSADMSDERTLVISERTATAAWAAYWEKKLFCQAKMQDG